MLKAISNLARGIAAVGGSPLSPRRDFTAALYAAEAERHRSILDQQDAGIPRNPPGFSIDDDAPGNNGFVPFAEAARRMGLSEDETLLLCERSLLEAYSGGSVLYVRPAIVSMLASGTRGEQEPLNLAGDADAEPVEFSPPEAA